MVQAYVLVAVEAGKERRVGDRLLEMEEVKKINELFGEWDIIALVETKETGDLDDLTAKIRGMKEVRLTSTLVVAR